MTIATEILDLLRLRLGPNVPRVRALHLPPSAWNGTKEAEFGALELEDGSVGLSFLLLGNTLAELSANQRPLAGADPLALAQRWRDGQGAERALGFAAVNALSRHLFDRAGFLPPAATDSIGGIDPQPGEHIGMVGLFTPLLKQVTARGARLTVIELRADLVGRHDDHEVTLDPAALQACDKVLCTSTVLLNDTLDHILAQCTRARAVAMIGPGAACLPQPLFARGVTLLGGSWVRDVPAMLAALREGTSWSPSAYKFALAPSDLPADLRDW